MLESAGSSFVSFNGVLASLITAVLINFLLIPQACCTGLYTGKEALACQFDRVSKKVSLAWLLIERKPLLQS